ncbi:C-X-C motif chemokine 15-like [Mus caroli]|uniref:C-X-C motif chemokine n=1 Tax=Mus caroli TaxID=10089 RepID=A0A6P5PLW4_MUSCR|nr:C-X-C motif chemokine 15-like [Mus caroli]
MAAQGWSMLLLAVLNLGIFVRPCDTEELRCLCIQEHSEFIPLKLIKNIMVIFETIYCNRKEVIAVLKNGSMICLDPDAPWVKTTVGPITDRFLPEGLQKREFPQAMEFLYSVEHKKPLYLSFGRLEDKNRFAFPIRGTSAHFPDLAYDNSDGN